MLVNLVSCSMIVTVSFSCFWRTTVVLLACVMFSVYMHGTNSGVEWGWSHLNDLSLSN